MTTSPCFGQYHLFDSTDRNDHAAAKAICATCPLIDACRDALLEARRASMSGSKYGPCGTWAGLLVGQSRRSPARIAAEADMFTPAELRTHHSAYTRGVRNDEVCAAERVYQTARKRRIAAQEEVAA